MSGGFNPAPFTFGASKHSVEETILAALNQGDGTGLTDEQASYNYAENFAIARAIADVWSTNKRLANQWDANRMTDFLGRWEAILDLHPATTDTPTARRAAVAAKLALAGQPATQQVIYDLAVRVLGSIFVQIANASSTTATASVPGGVTIPGGVTLPDGVWASGIANVAIKVEQPAAMTDQEFYTTAGAILPYLDGLLPAWVDFNWFREDVLGVGFFLDQIRNLDNSGFA